MKKIYIGMVVISIIFTGCHDYSDSNLDQRIPLGQHLTKDFRSVGSSDQDGLERYKWLKKDPLFSSINVDTTNEGKIVTVAQLKNFSNSSDAREFFDHAFIKLSKKNGSMTCHTEFLTPDKPIFTITTCTVENDSNQEVVLNEMISQTGYISAYANRYLPLFLLKPISILFSDAESFVSIQYKED